MDSNFNSLIWWSSVISLVVLLLTLAFYSQSMAAESGEFSGSWVSNGTREFLPFGDDREVYTFKISGHVNLQTTLGKTKDYWSQCIGLSDSATGAVARCVWRDLDGPEIYLTLKSDKIQKGNLVTGEIIGGTRHLQGIQGAVSFKWTSVSFQREGNKATVMGQVLDLRGEYQIP